MFDDLSLMLKEFWTNLNKTKKQKALEKTKMNLLSLPDEMLANVLKYSKFSTVSRLRKMNKRIDNVTVGYGVHIPQIHTFTANSRVLHFKHYTTELFKHRFYGRAPVSIRCWDTLWMLEKYLEKSRRLGYLEITDIRIGYDWLNMLKNLKHKYRVEVTLNGCLFTAPLDDIKTVLSEFRSVRIAINKGNVNVDKNIVTDKILCSLISFANIELLYKDSNRCNFPNMTDETLKKLQRVLPKKFVIGKHFTKFTIPEVIRTLKIRYDSLPETKDGKYFHRWDLGRVKASSREEMLESVEKMRSLGFYVGEELRHYSLYVDEDGPYIEIWAKNAIVKIVLD